MAKYLKLGEGANTFHDPITGVNLSNKQVIRILNDEDIQKPSIAKAIRTGHLVKSNKQEWDEYKQTNAQQVEESQKNLKVVKTVTTVSHLTGDNKKADSGESEDVDEDEDDEDVTDTTSDEEDEDLTKSELIDKLKESPLIKEEEKKTLNKVSLANLQGLWKSIKPKS